MQARERVSAAGTKAYLPEQFIYEMLRRRKGSASKFAAGGKLWVFIAGAVAAVILRQYAPTWLVVSACVLMLLAWLLVVFRTKPSRAKISALVQKFETHNPSERRVPASAAIAQTMQELRFADLPAAYGAVLICEHQRMVDFFCANQFYLHHACAVIGAKAYGLDFYPDLAVQLRERRDLKIFVLHDYSPHGVRFAQIIADNPPWLGYHEALEVLDIGLVEKQVSTIAAEMRPLAEFTTAKWQAPGRDNRSVGLELSSIRAQELLMMVGVAVDEGRPMTRLEKTSSSSDSGG
ncbi:MAG: hypothetical protein ACI8W7_002135 [Gammaproteobacteria bacterium]|jgi:hypothetical protein